jgi:hypothetical protein
MKNPEFKIKKVILNSQFLILNYIYHSYRPISRMTHPVGVRTSRIVC